MVCLTCNRKVQPGHLFCSLYFKQTVDKNLVIEKLQAENERLKKRWEELNTHINELLAEKIDNEFGRGMDFSLVLVRDEMNKLKKDGE